MISPNYPAINPPRALPPEALEDCFRPPTEPVMVRCLHCDHEYTSDLIYWDDTEGPGKGFWRCPIEDCGGAGFQFDIHPLDSSLWCDDDEGGIDECDEFDGRDGCDEELDDEDSEDRTD